MSWFKIWFTLKENDLNENDFIVKRHLDGNDKVYLYLHGTPGIALQQIVKNGAVHSSPKFLLPDPTLGLGCPRRREGGGV